MFGLYRCPDCEPEHGCEEHGDDCRGAEPWASELPELDYPLPACPCCSRPAELIVPLVPLDSETLQLR
jgi:hypothetical protein